MPDIVLATLNAKYIHAAFGLRCLFANMGALRERTAIAEFDIAQRPLEIAERLLAMEPRIIGLGVYIWNVTPTAELVALLKRLRPEVKIVIGGPEVSFETEEQPIAALADHVISGEADLAFPGLCARLLEGVAAPGRIIHAPLPPLAALTPPYAFYTADDIAHRVLYVEASRGCPFTCEFCLSSRDIPVRQFPLEPFLAELDALLKRGARLFKFVDRTFNLNLSVSTAILRFFQERWRDGLFLHFEMIPDRLPPQLRDLLATFPPGGVQLEVGIQTFDEATSANISRRQNVPRIEENLRWLRANTGVHIHADLIAGLPGESLEQFGAGFDRLLAMQPQEIQVGILKRLRGTPIIRHDAEHGMIYSPNPPYELLANRHLDFPTMQRLRRFSRYWDLVANSGNFPTTHPRLWHGATPFVAFLKFCDWLHAHIRRTHGIALDTLARALFDYLTGELSQPPAEVAASLASDWCAGGRKDAPPWLAEHTNWKSSHHAARTHTQRRQARHLSAAG